MADVAEFTAWLIATDQRRTGLADRLSAQFRGEVELAFRAWEATSPLTNPSAFTEKRTSHLRPTISLPQEASRSAC
ncbi:MAG TPA: hypothetical protein VNF24_06820 [Candidatus Acidoferrales bacterium]|nr:hypothetical protein [Candidatus Acidoferrales bacterium]